VLLIATDWPDRAIISENQHGVLKNFAQMANHAQRGPEKSASKYGFLPASAFPIFSDWRTIPRLLSRVGQAHQAVFGTTAPNFGHSPASCPQDPAANI